MRLWLSWSFVRSLVETRSKNNQRLASVAFSALEGLLRRLRAAQVRQRLRQLGQKTALYQNFDINAFDFIEGKE